MPDDDFGQLPTKLSAIVKEYLRQRQSGSLNDHWEVASQLAQLLRAAFVGCSGNESEKLLNTIRDILLKHDDTITLTIHALFTQAVFQSDMNEFVESVRAAPEELSDVLSEVLGGAGKTVVHAIGSEHKVALRALKRSSDAVLITDLTRVTHELEDAKRCVIIARGLHADKGAAAGTGAQVLARAARRLGIPIIVAAAQFSQLPNEANEGLSSDGRAHPGGNLKMTSIGADVEVVRRNTSWIPLSLIDVIVTENGGVSSRYFSEKRKL